MSDEFVNQLTLNFLINKQQLQKLNQQNKKNAEQSNLDELNAYKIRIKQLFSDLLDNNPPDDLLYYVKTTFDAFVEKSMYYLRERPASPVLNEGGEGEGEQGEGEQGEGEGEQYEDEKEREEYDDYEEKCDDEEDDEENI